MAEQVQELINKIKQEGIQEGEAKAQKIEAEAKKHAEEIVQNAREETQRIVEQGKKEIEQNQESVRAALRQAGRDMVLKLKEHINEVLRTVIEREVRDSLDAGQLSGLIEKVIKAYMDQQRDVTDIKLLLSEKDLKQLSDGFAAKLKDRLKHPVAIQSATDISGGFIISFNNDSNTFDFTDISLVQYLANFLNDDVAALLSEAVGSKDA